MIDKQVHNSCICRIFTNVLSQKAKEIVVQKLDGVAMWSPLAPALADVSFCHHQRNWLGDGPIASIFYKHYMDVPIAKVWKPC